jgi:hypothetical protein
VPWRAPTELSATLAELYAQNALGLFAFLLAVDLQDMTNNIQQPSYSSKETTL